MFPGKCATCDTLLMDYTDETCRACKDEVEKDKAAQHKYEYDKFSDYVFMHNRQRWEAIRAGPTP